MDYPSGLHIITCIPKSREPLLAAENQRDGSMIRIPPTVAGFEEKRRGHEPRNVRVL